ncbi:hypothetical protein HII36_46370 [Nonomuraea sp. NN258]|nr:hypothetical protein [Nonomuraea antri]NRQ39199.1 hypothetical protein [Nonomuraea antri]
MASRLIRGAGLTLAAAGLVLQAVPSSAAPGRQRAAELEISKEGARPTR